MKRLLVLAVVAAALAALPGCAEPDGRVADMAQQVTHEQAQQNQRIAEGSRIKFAIQHGMGGQPHIRGTLSAGNPLLLVDVLVMHTAITHAAPRLNLLHLLAVGIVLPACLATANHLLLTSSPSDLNAFLLCLLMGFYVLQIGCIGWAVGKVTQPWPLRWFIYGWLLVLVDLQLAVMNSNGGRSYEGISCLSTAVFAGQLGMIIVWGVLGSGHIIWRIPAILVVLTQFWAFFHLLIRLKQGPPGSAYLDWGSLLTIQAVLLAVLCGSLRLRGYSLLKVEAETKGAAADKTKVPLQFGIRDVMIWTTSLAVLLAIAKAADFLTMNFLRNLYAPDILLSFTIGIITAVVLIVALWSALGRGNPAIRCLVLTLLTLGLGGAIGWYCDAQAKAKAMAGGFSTSYWQWYSTGYWWIGWMFLTGALLAASLTIYRTLGYRLVRRAKRPRGTPAAVVALPD